MGDAYYATQLVKYISVLDSAIWIARAAKKVSLQTAQRCFQKAGLSTNESTYNKIDKSNIQSSRSLSIRLCTKMLRYKITLASILGLKQKLMRRKLTSSLTVTSNARQGKILGRRKIKFPRTTSVQTRGIPRCFQHQRVS
jgi:hypothetical protein